MPDEKESLYPHDWFKKGKQDLKAAKSLLSSGDLEVASMLIQQAIEKYLKGYLLSKGWKLRRIHDLEELLDEAILYNADSEKFRSLCQTATVYYTKERYPFLVSSKLSREELEDIFEQAQEFTKRIREEIE